MLIIIVFIKFMAPSMVRRNQIELFSGMNRIALAVDVDMLYFHSMIYKLILNDQWVLNRCIRYPT